MGRGRCAERDAGGVKVVLDAEHFIPFPFRYVGHDSVESFLTIRHRTLDERRNVVRASAESSTGIGHQTEELVAPERAGDAVLLNPAGRAGLDKFVVLAIGVFAEGVGGEDKAGFGQMLRTQAVETFDVGLEPERGE